MSTAEKKDRLKVMEHPCTVHPNAHVGVALNVKKG